MHSTEVSFKKWLGIPVVQNTTARFFSGARWNMHITPVLPTSYQLIFKVLTITHKALHGISPS